MPVRPAVPRAVLMVAACLVAASILACGGCSQRDSSADRRPAGAGGASWSEVSPGSPPLNLILITLDTTRRDRLSCYGYEKRTTPNLDRIGEQGILFEQAYAPVPVTLPSHATMLTGLYPFEHGTRHNGCYVVADSLTTLAEMLKKKGYDTGAVLAAFSVEHRFGLDQGFDHYEDRFMAPSGAERGEEAQRRGDEVTRLSLEWIGQHAERPFFLWVHYFDPHAPYHPPEPHKSRFAGAPYDGEVASMDSAIGELMEGLESMGLDDRTVLVVAADHGEGLGDHGELTHCTLIYGATQEVPFLMRFPARDRWADRAWRGRRVRGLVSLTDVLPTAWNALGYPQSELPAISGLSLLPLVEGTGSGHEWLYHETLVPDLDYGMSELRGYQAGGWKYIRGPEPELYDLENDPGEIANLAGRHRDRAASMEAALAEVLRAEERIPPPAPMDEETLEKLRSLGYLRGGQPAARAKPADPKAQAGVPRATARAQTLAESGRLPEAVAALDSILAAHPTTRMALRLRALYLTELGRGPEALNAYERALADCEGCPDEFRLLQGQASAYLVSGRTGEALTRAWILLEARPEEQGLNLLLGEILEKRGDAAGARSAYAREAELFPQDPAPLVKLGTMAANEKRSLEAQQLIDRALALDPASFEANYRKAWLLREGGRKTAAVTHLRAAVERQPRNAALLYELGSLYGELGRGSEARSCYERAIATGEAPAGAYSNLAVLAANAGSLAEAVGLWQQALERRPTSQEAQVIRRNIEKAQGMARGQGG